MMKVKKADAFVLTTNGFVTKTGNAVLGRGIAKTISDKFPQLKAKLGKKLAKQKISKCHVFKKMKVKKAVLIAFPVKPVNLKCNVKKVGIVSHAKDKYKKGDLVPGFHAIANLRIIEESCKQLVKLADKHKWKRVIMPRPGCGAGELKWKHVMNILETYLDDRFHVYTFKPNPHTVFISGSRSITNLPKRVYRKLDLCIHSDAQIVIGDCYGVDTAVQQYLALRKYPNVVVCHIGVQPRNSNKQWKNYKVKGKFQTDKDKFMTKISDSALIIWDGESKGSLNNSKRMKRNNKPVWIVNSFTSKKSSKKRSKKSSKK